ncbi:MAG: SGNH/GDSL hydrolase family protein, partial [Planctomycetota bacterium]|nr:SGNH/GDSL hydrolase family protein [Planctomycetota bacterium]
AVDAVPDDVVWHDVRDWGVEGRGFDDTESYFDRLPSRAKDVVRKEVWNLSRDSSGMSADFEADADAIYVRYELNRPRIAMPHMPATGVSGVDLYGRMSDRWRWLQVTRPETVNVTAPLVTRLAPGRRAYRAYLPLYNGVKSFEIGVPKGATLSPIAPRNDKPICFYGTSITHGACASRPGMSFVNLLGRRLNRSMLNFGFSGNGRMELEVGRFLAELDPAVYVIDCVANTPPEQITQRTGPLVKLLRNVHPSTPILLLEQRAWANHPLVPHQAQSHAEKCAALRAAFDALIAQGVTNLHYRTGGDELIGADGEGTTDGSHPNDLGMMRYADALEPSLRALL